MGQSIYHRLPDSVRRAVDRVQSWVPAPWRQRRQTGRVLKFLRECEFWTHEQWREYQNRRIRELVAYAYERVPYYREVWKQHGVKPADIDGTDALVLLPTMDNQTLAEYSDALQARGIPERQTLYMTTGGTMGRPTRFRLHRRISQDSEVAFIQDMWKRVGYRAGDRRIILRVGEDPRSDRVRAYYYAPPLNAYCFRSFMLGDEHLATLVDLLRRFRPLYLHTYPSAAAVLALYVKRQGIQDLPPLKAVLASSENFPPEQRELIAQTLKTRMFSWYGHAEQTVLAGECEYSTAYHVHPAYGFLELLDDDGKRITAPGVSGQMVGTNFYNPVVPMIRYRSGDWTAWAGAGCPQCRRNFPLITDVKGHYYQEMIVHADGHLTHVTAINVHGDLYRNIRQYQLHQKEKGKVTLKLVTTPDWSPADEVQLGRLIRDRLPGVEVRIEHVDHIPPTARGKWKYFVQELDTGKAWFRSYD
jgi:phenylacetate-CoA ligase